MTTIVSQQTLTALLDGATPLDLRAESGVNVTVDEGWAPYVQADITVPLPVNVEPFDPREDHRVMLTARQDWGTSARVSVLSAEFAGQTVADLSASWAGLTAAQVTALYYEPYNSFGVRSPERSRFDLMLRDRIIDRAAATMTLRLTSDEATLIDRLWVDTEVFNPSTTNVRTIVTLVLQRIGAVLEPGTATGTVEADATIQRPGVSDWDYLAPLLQQANLRLWCDERRRWRLEPSETTQAGSFRIDALDTIDDSDTIERNSPDVYDAVVITYRWTDTLGAQQTAHDIATTENWSKALEIVYDNTRYPGAGAAANVLRRARGRGRARELRAVAQLLTRPGQAATITVGDDTQNGFVSSVQYRWPDDEMTIRTRGLVDIPTTAWAFDPPGVPWSAIPAGIDWSEDI